jgi:hypothetical protein
MEEKQLTSHCIHCGKYLERQSGGLWNGPNMIAPQYCWIDPEHGSRLHEPDPTYTRDL